MNNFQEKLESLADINYLQIQHGEAEENISNLYRTMLVIVHTAGHGQQQYFMSSYYFLLFFKKIIFSLLNIIRLRNQTLNDGM